MTQARGKKKAKGGLNAQDVKYLKQTLSELPNRPIADQDAHIEVDRLLQFAYHQNPYLRMFTKVLWSGYAMSRGQVLECHERFKQAHRDAQMSSIDEVTIRSLDHAASTLEQAMAPDGSVTDFLTVMRDNTLRRMWSRVCETSSLPPPSFNSIFGTNDGNEMTIEEIEAAEAAEIAALTITPPETTDAEEAETAEGDEPEAGDAVAAPDEDGSRDNDEDEDEDGSRDNDDAGGDGTLETGDGREDHPPNEPQPFNIEVSRQGGSELAAELLLSAGSEILRTLRGRSPQGDVSITVTVSGDGVARRRRRRGGRRRRRGGQSDRSDSR